MNRESVEAGVLASAGFLQGALKYYVRPELTALRGWSILGLGIIAYELACPSGELLSEGCTRAIQRSPLVTRLGIGLIALHLADAIPDKLDPLTQGLRFLKNE